MKPDLHRRDPVQRWCLIVITVVVAFACLDVAQDILAPTLLALITGVILSPVTTLLERLGLPRGLVAILVLVLGLAAIAVAVILLEPIVWRIVDEIPRIQSELRGFVAEFRNLVRGLDQVNKEVEEALGAGQAAAEDEGAAAASAMPRLTDALFLAPVVGAQVLIFLGTLFFFLLTRQDIYVWIAHRFADQGEGGSFEAIKRFRTAERMVSRYFLTVTVINAGLGAALASGLVVVGLPGPFVWGAVAAVLNFVLYLGPIMVIAGLFLAGVVAFDGPMVLLPPLLFTTLNMIEAQFVTPALVGRHIAVNPLLIFMSLVVWVWLWGPIGGIVAIPVLVIVMALLNIFETVPDPGRK